MEIYVTPIIEAVIEAITQNLKRSICVIWNVFGKLYPERTGVESMVDEGFVRGDNNHIYGWVLLRRLMHNEKDISLIH
jgi:hypothetical protein